MLTLKEIETIQEGEWELPCSDVSLYRKRDGRRFSGPGFIRWRDGSLRCHFYAGLIPEGEFFFDANVGLPRVPAGTLIPDDYYFEMTARDWTGRYWLASWAQPDFQTGETRFATVELDEIKQSDDGLEGEPESAKVTIFDDFKFPCNVVSHTEAKEPGGRGVSSSSLSHASVNVCGCDLWIGRMDGRVEAWIGSDSPLPPFIHIKIVECLQFMLAKPMQWAAVEFRHGMKTRSALRSQRADRSPTVMHAPIHLSGMFDTSGDFWRLFEAYLSLLVRDSTEEWHPVSRWVFTTLGGGRTLYGHGLALSVAVEGLLTSQFANRGQPAKGDQVERLVSHLESLGEDTPLLSRAVGSIRMMLKPRAMDCLMALKAEGVATELQIKAWQRLRNKVAHGAPLDDRSLDEMVDLCNTVTVLFYRLIFNVIGYAGTYQDYGTKGFPRAKFPDAGITGEVDDG